MALPALGWVLIRHDGVPSGQFGCARRTHRRLGLGRRGAHCHIEWILLCRRTRECGQWRANMRDGRPMERRRRARPARDVHVQRQRGVVYVRGFDLRASAFRAKRNASIARCPRTAAARTARLSRADRTRSACMGSARALPIRRAQRSAASATAARWSSARRTQWGASTRPRRRRTAARRRSVQMARASRLPAASSTAR